MKDRARKRRAAQRRGHRLGALPAKVRIGRGYVVKVAHVTPSHLQEIADDDEPNCTAGCWITEDMTIYIDNSLPLRRQWETYFHELQHAVHDISELNRGGI